jgi:hypothetical protein
VAATVCGAPPVAPVSIFDGKTLDGWLQIENSATSLSTAGIVDPAAVRRETGERLGCCVRLPAQPPVGGSALSGPSIYDKARFTGVALRAETAQAVASNLTGLQLTRAASVSRSRCGTCPGIPTLRRAC